MGLGLTVPTARDDQGDHGKGGQRPKCSPHCFSPRIGEFALTTALCRACWLLLHPWTDLGSAYVDAQPWSMAWGRSWRRQGPLLWIWHNPLSGDAVDHGVGAETDNTHLLLTTAKSATRRGLRREHARPGGSA
jgi:hypothetical protein